MGLSPEEARPDWMIITVLPVPPPQVRPSIAVDGGMSRGEDDLTYKLAEIIKANTNVQKCEQEGHPAHVIQEFEALLQVWISAGPVWEAPIADRSFLYSGTLRPIWTTIKPVNLRLYRNPVDPSNRSELV